MGGTTWNYEYMICNEADEAVYRRQCKALEENLPGLVKGKLLQDVDGSDYQQYTLRDARIEVGNDCFADRVFVRSDIDLLPFFQEKRPAQQKPARPQAAARPVQTQ